jgi:hypothetical protein
MKGIFLFISLFIYISSLSQTECIQAIDENNTTVPYVTMIVKMRNSVFTGDSLGKVCLTSDLFIKNGDTIFISAIGYENLNEVYTGKKVFILKRKNILLPEVVIVNGEGILETWGTKKNDGSAGGFRCRQVFHQATYSLARIIYPDADVKKAEIRSIAFHDETGRGIDVPVRVRIFLIGKDSLPLNDYLQENIFLGTKGKGWIEADLEGKGLIVPKEGIAIGIELFANSDEYFYTEKIKNRNGKKRENKLYGFSLARESDDGFLTLMKFNTWRSWVVERFDHHNCGNLVCRVKVKVWR